MLCFVNPRRHYSKSKYTRIHSRIGSPPSMQPHPVLALSHTRSQRVPDFDLFQICLVFIAFYLSPVKGVSSSIAYAFFAPLILILSPVLLMRFDPNFPFSTRLAAAVSCPLERLSLFMIQSDNPLINFTSNVLCCMAAWFDAFVLGMQRRTFSID